MTDSPIVLVVDDDHALLEALPETLRLRMPGVVVETCDSGSAGLERILATDYDVIVSDIKMPEMDGLALLDQIRLLRPDTPTLLITGHGEHDLAVQSLRAGAYDYIQKPIDRDYLVASLRRAVQVRQLRRRVADQQAVLERHARELEQRVQTRTSELRDAVERIRALTEVAVAIHAARDVSQVLRSVAEATCRLSGARLAAAAFFHGHAGPDRFTDTQAWDVIVTPPDAGAPPDVAAMVPMLAYVSARGESERVDDAQRHPVFRRAPLGVAPTASYLAVPVRSRTGETLGVIVAGHGSPRWFTEEGQAQIEALARQAAVALENAVLYERERGIAETLQRSLLPDRLPEVPGITLAARYCPGRGDAVGGDWYDVFTLPAGQIALVMGDVAGKGVWAASAMGQLRNALRAYAIEGNPPAVIAERLNRLIEPGTMATLAYLVFDPITWAIRYVNLGHPPALVLTPDGAASFLDGGHPPLGATFGLLYREQAVALQPDSTLVLYTDGLVETRGEPIDVGLGRIREVAARAAGFDLERMLDRLVAVAVDGAAAANDDVALLALRASRLDPARITVRLPAVPSSLMVLRHTLRRWFDAAGLGEVDAYEILTACNEACANTIEHAYGPADGSFELEAVLSGGEVVVTVRDAGRWREACDSRGCGFRLMRALMDVIETAPGPDGTLVRMRRRLAAQRGACA
jgi:serine phosphatase RsbU (regulator of sigma subunit)/FixJ family two-component response regulator/anti-sigma regulatory factor (Ser/Thr protein kinase)